MKIPPAIIGLAFLFAIAVVSALLPQLVIDVPLGVRAVLAAALLLAGTLLILVAGIQFSRAHTTIDPRDPFRAGALVTTGVFRISRNPMYLGFVLILLAATCWYAHPVGLLLVVVFAVLIDRLQIPQEEVALEKLFPQEYAEYRRKVRRWL